MSAKNWREIVEQAGHYIAIGQLSHYIADYEDKDGVGDYPWEYVGGAKAGGMSRLDFSVGIDFVAQHPIGLEFRWSFDTELRNANGYRCYKPNGPLIERILAMLSGQARTDFAEYLVAWAGKIETSGDEMAEIARAAYGHAAFFRKVVKTADPDSAK